MADKEMNGKVVLITGATLGIGKETALGLAKRGAQLVIVGRDLTRTQDVAQWLKTESENPNIDYLIADLSSLTDVRKLAQTFKSKYQRLDVLINNAGGIFMSRETSIDGFEKTWALNYLAYFTFTMELVDLLKASAPSRVVSVSSELYAKGKLKFDDLQMETSYSGWRAYCQSKLATVLFTYALARKLAGTGVTVNCLHPGGVATGIGKNNSIFFRFLIALARPFFITPEEGAKTSIYVASSPELARVTGKYFDKCKAVETNKQTYDISLQDRLWAVSVDQSR